MYYDNSTKPSAQQQSYVAYIGYDLMKKLSLGLEYNYQTDYNLQKDKDLGGLSAYATYFVDKDKKYQVFARYDYLSSNTLENEESPWNYNVNGNYFVAGFQYRILKGIKVAINYRGFQSENTDIDFENMLYINFEYRLRH